MVVVLVKDEAARDAERLLDTVWWSTANSGIPVDPVRIARRLGIDVVDAGLDTDVSAALVKEKGQDPTILLNWIDSPNRKRFSCAHEIGHFMRRSEQPDEYEYVDFRDQLSGAGTDLDEVYANCFAACLLMPEAHVRSALAEDRSEIELAYYFDVSREAMHTRLLTLGLV